MHIALVDLENKTSQYINKEMNGGLGRRICLDTSWRGRLLLNASKRMFYTPPIALAYLAAIFDRRGFAVSLSRSGEIPAEADAVIFQSSIADYENDLKAARRIKETNPAVRVGFTGAFPTFMPDLFLAAGDFVISGEPEAAAQKLFSEIEPRGVIRELEIADLDELPFPKWDLFFGPTGPSRHNMRGLPVYASRGCSFACSYCPYISYFGRTRTRKVEGVFEELKYMVRKWNIRRFLFRDPDFTENKKRVHALLDLIQKNKLNIRWSCETRLDLLDEQLLDAMRNAGCIEIGAGIESKSPQILADVARKPISEEKVRRMTEYASRIGILIQGNYILALPEDTEETMHATLDYAHSLNTPLANFSIFTPYPGTRAWPDFKDQVNHADYEQYDLAHLVFKHARLTNEQVHSAYNLAYKDYYFRLGWFVKNFGLILKSHFN